MAEEQGTRANIEQGTKPNMGRGTTTNVRDDAVRRMLEIIDRQFEQLERYMAREEQGSSRSNNFGELSCERFRRLHPPSFDGQSADPAHAEEWIWTLEDMFDYAKIEDTEKVTCAVFMLTRDLRYWWDTVKETTNVKEIEWKRFKEVFYEKDFSKTVKNKLMEFVQLRQTGSVPEYIRKFEALARFAGHLVSDEENKIHHFVQGLKPKIYRGVRISGTEDQSYPKVISKALDVEEAEIKF